MIDTPNENPNIPEDLAKKIKDVSNAVTLAQAELVRLRELQLSETLVIQENHKRKQELLEHTEKLSKEVETKINQLAKLQEGVLNAQNQLRTIEKAQNEITLGNEQEHLEIAKKTKELKEKMSWVETKVLELQDIEKKIKGHEQIISNKKELLEKALKELNA